MFDRLSQKPDDDPGKRNWPPNRDPVDDHHHYQPRRATENGDYPADDFGDGRYFDDVVLEFRLPDRIVCRTCAAEVTGQCALLNGLSIFILVRGRTFGYVYFDTTDHIYVVPFTFRPRVSSGRANFVPPPSPRPITTARVICRRSSGLLRRPSVGQHALPSVVVDQTETVPAVRHRPK